MLTTATFDHRFLRPSKAYKLRCFVSQAFLIFLVLSLHVVLRHCFQVVLTTRYHTCYLQVSFNPLPTFEAFKQETDVYDCN